MPIVTESEYLAMLEASGSAVSDAGRTALTTCVPLIQQAIEKLIGFPIIQASHVEFYPGTITNYAGGGDYLVGNWDVSAGRAIAQVRDHQYRRILGLRCLPIRSITEVCEFMGAWDGGLDGLTFPYFPATSILPASSYRADFGESGVSWTGRVIRNHGIWIRDLRCIKVTYVAGLTQAEVNADYGDLKLALLTSIQSAYIGIVMRALAAESGGFVQSTSITDFSESIGDPKTIGVWFDNNYMLPPEAQRMLSRYINLRRYAGG